MEKNKNSKIVLDIMIRIKIKIKKYVFNIKMFNTTLMDGQGHFSISSLPYLGQ